MTSNDVVGGLLGGTPWSHVLLDILHRRAAEDPNGLAIGARDGELSNDQLLKALAEFDGTSDRVIWVRNTVEGAVELLRATMADCPVLLLPRGLRTREEEAAVESFREGWLQRSEVDMRAGVVLLTSGGRGVPKLVLRPWPGVVANALDASAALGLGNGDIVLCAAALNHSYGFSVGLLSTLISSAGLLLTSGALTLEELSAAVARGATAVQSVPLVYQRLVTSSSLCELSSVHTWITAGDQVDPMLAEQWYRATGRRLVNHYGTTEVGMISFGRTGGDDVGTVLPGIEIYLEPHDKVDSPAGVLNGRCRTRPAEYWNGEAGASDDGWFRTDDLAYVGSDGAIRLIGRSSARINVAGNKVDAAEVEQVLREHDAVHDAAVLGGTAADGGEQVLAYVAGTDVVVRELRAFLAGRLSVHKVPTTITVTQSIPRTATGKVRQGELASGWNRPAERAEATQVPQQDDLERRILAVSDLGFPADADLEVHTLVSHDHVLLYLFALASLAKYWIDATLVVHDDGTLTERDENRILRAAPNARIVRDEAAERVAAEVLRDHPTIRSVRATNVRLRQIVDYYLHCRTDRVLAMDSDVVFLNRPETIIEWAAAPDSSVPFFRYSPERGWSVKGPHWLPDAVPGRPFLSDLCCGFACVRPSRFVDWNELEAMMSVTPPEILYHRRFVTQMYYSLLAGRLGQNQVEDLGEPYRSGRLHWLPQDPNRVLCHYFASHGRDDARANLVADPGLFATALDGIG